MADNKELIEKLGNMADMGYRVMTISDLVQRLAGLPPMMEVYANMGGDSMFVNDVQLQEAEGYSPFIRIICDTHPRSIPVDSRTHDEKVAEMRQRAMDMSAQIERESQMHPRVD